MNKSFTALAVLFSLTCVAHALDTPPNVALGKKYRLEPRPNYSHCTEPGDRTQLTDGVYTKGYFWTQKTTVGWVRAYPAVITIDLGEIQPIRGVSYSTAAGVAGVEWPGSIRILVSDDGRTYYIQGDLVELDRVHGKPQTEAYGLHRFRTDALRTHGRFVKLIIVAQGSYTFVDEIEVYRGDDAWLREPLTGRQVSDVKESFAQLEVAGAVRRRLRDDLAVVREALEKADLDGNLRRELDAVEREIPGVEVTKAADFRAVLPLNPLHRRIFAVQAAVWRSRCDKPIVIWQTGLWDMLSPTEPPRDGGAQLDVAMMSNEFRAAAFNISNAGDNDVMLRISIAGLPGAPNPEYITVHEVPFTGTKSGVPVAAALPVAKKAGNDYVVEVAAGMTRQVWFTFHPTNVPAGEYTGAVTVEPGGNRIPLKLKIYPFKFPDQPALHLAGWDYTNNDRFYSVTPENRDALIAHLREHFVDTPWATSGALARGEYDKDGNMTREPDAANFEQWLLRWPGARNYYVFVALRSKFAGFEIGTPPFKKAVAAWITWWVNKLKEWDLKPEQLGLLLVDETHSHEKDKIIIEYAEVIQQIQPDVVIWEDPTWRKPWDALPEMFRLCDILCPNLPMLIQEGKPFADFYIKQRDAGRTLWFYSCSGPGKLLDPYAYHRMQHWFCWKFQAKGSCFWAFGDSSGASSWNEYLSSRGAFTPLFIDPKTVTAGKHMEAIREGIEDYEYLRILRDRIAQLEKQGKRAPDLAAAKELLTSAADRVTACMTERDKIKWEEPKDRSVADRVRVEVLDMLVRLRGL